MRSKLFVPASREELFHKALRSAADAVSFDLEDAVADSRKDEARALLSRFLKSDEAQASDKIFIVRSNGIGSAYFEEDVFAITCKRLNILNLPKVESSDDIEAAVSVIKCAEKAAGITDDTKILANIESPKGLRLAAEIAAAHPRVVGLQLGLNDLFGALAIDRKDTKNIHAAMYAVRLAAGEAGIFAFDGAYADMADEKGLIAEASMARRLGFWGKSCIHPKQIDPINKVFVPSEDEIIFSQKVIDANRQAIIDGIGAFTVDGKMIDRPIIKRAEAVITASQNLQKYNQAHMRVSPLKESSPADE